MGDTVRRETGQFLSADGKSKIHVAKWLPEKEPVAVLQMVHGMQEYIERYEPFARYLADRDLQSSDTTISAMGPRFPTRVAGGSWRESIPATSWWRTCIGTTV